ncbi:hypothetical protein [Agrococcus pavilionensis]|nr:hypothetical protein [Agrococcus pavilionensis]
MRAEDDADRVRELRRTAPAVHPALVHEGMVVLNRRGQVGEVLTVTRRVASVLVRGRRWRRRERWSLESIIESRAA